MSDLGTGFVITGDAAPYVEATEKAAQASKLMGDSINDVSAASRRYAAQIVTAADDVARAKAQEKLSFSLVTDAMVAQAREAGLTAKSMSDAAAQESAAINGVAVEIGALKEKMIADEAAITLSFQQSSEAIVASAAKVDAAQSAASSEKMGTAISNAGKAGALGLGLIGVAAVKAAADFQSSTTHLVTDAGETQANIGMVSNALLAMAGQVGYSATALSNGMYAVESAGFHGADGLTVMRAAAEGAKVGNADLNTVTDAVTTALNAYGLQAKDSVAVTDQLIATTASGKVHMQDLAGSLSAVLPVAAANKISLADVGGAIATMTGQGVSADQATQNLANAIDNLSKPSNVAVQTMQQLGISSNDVSQKLGSRGVTGTLEYLSDAILQKMGPAGLVLQNSFNVSKAAGDDLQVMLAKMPANLQQLSKSFLDGSTSAKDYRTEIRNMGSDGFAEGSQFLAASTKANGFNEALKDGTPAAKTYTAELSAMTGGQTGLNVALELTGSHTASTVANVKAVGDASRNAGKDVQDWAAIQKTFNQQLDQAKDSVESVAIKLGQDLIPALTSVARFLAQGNNGMIAFVSAATLAATATGVWATKLAVGAVSSLLSANAGMVNWIANLRTTTTATEAATAAETEMGLAASAAATGGIALLLGGVVAAGIAIVNTSHDMDNFTDKVKSQQTSVVDSYGQGATTVGQFNAQLVTSSAQLKANETQALAAAAKVDVLRGNTDATRQATVAYTDSLSALNAKHQEVMSTAQAVADTFGVSLNGAISLAQQANVNLATTATGVAIPAISQLGGQAIQAAQEMNILANAANNALSAGEAAAALAAGNNGIGGRQRDAAKGYSGSKTVAALTSLAPIDLGTPNGGGATPEVGSGAAGSTKAAADEMLTTLANLRASESTLAVEISRAVAGTQAQQQQALSDAQSMVQQAQATELQTLHTKDHAAAVTVLAAAQRQLLTVQAALAKDPLTALQNRSTSVETQQSAISGSGDSAAKTLAADQANEKAAKTLLDQAEAFAKSKAGAKDHAAALAEVKKAQDDYTASQKASVQAAADVIAAQQQARQDLVDLTNAMQETQIIGADPVTTAVAKLAEAQRQLGIDTQGTTKWFQDQATVMQDTLDVTNATITAQQTAQQNAVDLANAQLEAAADPGNAMQAAQNKVTEAMNQLAIDAAGTTKYFTDQAALNQAQYDLTQSTLSATTALTSLADVTSVVTNLPSYLATVQATSSSYVNPGYINSGGGAATTHNVNVTVSGLVTGTPDQVAQALTPAITTAINRNQGRGSSSVRLLGGS